jgi:hypothetical protein
MFPNVLDGWSFPLFTKLRLVDSALDLMKIFKITGILINAEENVFFIY